MSKPRMLWILLFGGVFCLLCAALYAPLTIRQYIIDLSKNLAQESPARESAESPTNSPESSPRVAAHTPITIALLSDLHSGRIYQREILQALQDKAPDLIALSGDMVDDREDMAGAWEFFTALAELLPNTPKLYVSGNHEFWSGEIVQIKQHLRELGVVVLDFHAPCQRLHIAGQEILAFGVDDPYVSAYDEQGRRKAHISLDGVLIDEAQWDRAKWRGGAWEQEWVQLVREHVRSKHCPLGSKIPESNTLDSSGDSGVDSGVDSRVDYPVDSRADSAPIRILLSHRPEFIKLFTSLPVDLILSGHTHGGQVRIPYLLNGLYAPNQGLFPRFGGGLYKLDSRPLESNTDSSKPDSATTSTPHTPQSQYLIISRGLSFNYRLPRVFNPPEVVFITLTR